MSSLLFPHVRLLAETGEKDEEEELMGVEGASGEGGSSINTSRMGVRASNAG